MGADEKGGFIGIRFAALRVLGTIAMACALVPSARAGVVVLPGAYADVEGIGGQSILQLVGGGTDQVIYQTNVLCASGIVRGTMLLGLSLRLDWGSDANWRSSAYDDFTVRIGVAALSAAETVPTFATNVRGGASGYTTVRSGPLDLPAMSFPGGEKPNAFGPIIMFETPFVYTGGGSGLVIEIRQKGNAEFNYAFDGFLRESIVGIQSFTATSYDATRAGDPTPTELTTILAFELPEPATLALLGLGVAGMVPLRRRRT